MDLEGIDLLYNCIYGWLLAIHFRFIEPRTPHIYGARKFTSIKHK